jgi:hypothetical protein
MKKLDSVGEIPFPACLATHVCAVDPDHPDASLLALGAGWNAAVAAYAKVFRNGDDASDGAASASPEPAETRLTDVGARILSQRARTSDGIVLKCRVLAYCRGDDARTARESAERMLADGWLSDMTAVDAIVADVLSLVGPSNY